VTVRLVPSNYEIDQTINYHCPHKALTDNDMDLPRPTTVPQDPNKQERTKGTQIDSKVQMIHCRRIYSEKGGSSIQLKHRICLT